MWNLCRHFGIIIVSQHLFCILENEITEWGLRKAKQETNVELQIWGFDYTIPKPISKVTIFYFWRFQQLFCIAHLPVWRQGIFLKPRHLKSITYEVWTSEQTRSTKGGVFKHYVDLNTRPHRVFTMCWRIWFALKVYRAICPQKLIVFFPIKIIPGTCMFIWHNPLQCVCSP